jgi:type IV secretory pathway TraG/TraD family ATPase VirD4
MPSNLPPKTNTASTAINTVPVSSQPAVDNVMALWMYAKSPTGLMVIAGLIAFWWLSREDNGKGKLATGRWGGSAELKAAEKTALKQIAAPKKNACSLYINTPEHMRKKLKASIKYPLPAPDKKAKKPKKVPTYYYPDTQQSIAVVGSAGSGKTYSVIDPLLRSAIDQGHSTVLYDFKYPGQAQSLSLYAKRRGYKVFIFAPGYLESCALNILDFITDSQDAVGAGQLAQVIVKNCSAGGGGGDAFFENAGMALVEGLFLLTKWIQEYQVANRKEGGEDYNYCDLLTTACLINLPNLGARLQFAAEEDPNGLEISRWTLQSLAQLISTHGGGDGNAANKTETSIVATAQDIFKKFIRKDFIGSFCQTTNLELDVDDKVLIVFGLNQVNRYSIGPLLAASMHMLISNNIVHSKPRRSPLIVSLDELPTVYLPALANWLAEARSAGFNAILGFQNFRQLQELYGENLGKVIFGNAANKFVFNPGEFESAEIISKYLGDEEITVTSKSRSSGKGGSSSTSKNQQARSLIAPNEILKMPRGKGLAISSGYCKKNEAFVPLLLDFKISDEDMSEARYMESKWKDWIDIVKAKMPQLESKELEEMFNKRAELCKRLFPEPPIPDKK